MTASSRSSATSASHVGALPGVDVAAQQLALRPAAGRDGAGGRLVLDRRPRPLQRAVDRGDGRVEQVGGLGAGPAEHVAQDQHRALAAGQPLDRGEERELHALARRVARGGVGDRVPRRRRRASGIRLDDGSARRGRRSSSSRQALVAIRYSQVWTEARRSKRSSDRQARSSVSWTTSSASWTRAEHPVAVDLERAAVRLDERAEGALVAGLGGGDAAGVAVLMQRLDGRRRPKLIGEMRARRAVQPCMTTTSHAPLGPRPRRRRLLHGRARHARRLDRADHHPARSRRLRRAARVDRQRLQPELRRAADDRLGARRPLRAPPALRRPASRCSPSPRPPARWRPTPAG